MNKIKTITVCLIIPIFILIAFTFLKIKNKKEFQQKVILAKETRKVVDYLMFDLREAREGAFQGVPADGGWHNRIVFIQARQGALEYLIKEGHLFRINKGKRLLIADNIAALRIRRQKETPYILEVQIEARKGVSLVYNLKVRVSQ